MAVEVSLATLKVATKSLEKLRRFVETGALYVMLDAIGDNQLRAARDALANVGLANNPRREIESAVTHLQGAHQAFSRLYDVDDGYSAQATFYRAIRLDILTCCSAALCYRYLDEPTLMRKMLRRARSAAQLMTFDSELDRIIAHPVRSWRRGASMVLSPIGATREQYQTMKGFGDEKVHKFAKRLKRL